MAEDRTLKKSHGANRIPDDGSVIWYNFGQKWRPLSSCKESFAFQVNYFANLFKFCSSCGTHFTHWISTQFTAKIRLTAPDCSTTSVSSRGLNAGLEASSLRPDIAKAYRIKTHSGFFDDQTTSVSSAVKREISAVANRSASDIVPLTFSVFCIDHLLQF